MATNQANSRLKKEFINRIDNEAYKVDNCGKNPRDEFPVNKRDTYKQNFSYFEDYMFNHCHCDVQTGAAIAGDGLLTDHGAAHIVTVMHYADAIIGDLALLNGFEIYLLLVAIHFHDLGNGLGRTDHEQRIGKIIDQFSSEHGKIFDPAEMVFITDIATAHGGSSEGDKDTIGKIRPDERYGNAECRPKMLASILRFADEISDNNQRSTSSLPIPKKNEVYHSYCECLDPVSIIGNTLKYVYRIPHELTQRKVGKGDTEVFLYDEILYRLKKCMVELEYCKKYSEGIIKLSNISVELNFIDPHSGFKAQEKNSFRLSLRGYPDTDKIKLIDYLDISEGSTQVNSIKFNDGESLRIALAERKSTE